MNNQSKYYRFLNQTVIYTLVSLLTGSAITAVLMVYSTKAQIPQLTPATSTNRLTTTFTNSGEVIAQQLPGDTTSQPVIPSMMAQTDQRFIVMMIPHHEGAVAMAELALSRAQHPEIKKLATAIKESQTREISQMQTWYKRWYGSDVPVWTPGIGMGIGRAGWGWQGMSRRRRSRTGCCMMGGGAGVHIYALQNASDFDREFIQQMIPHHQMAVMMSAMVLNSTEHPELRNLAKSIINSQSAEIQQMQQWYQTWYQ